MSNPKILLTGSRGWLAGEIGPYLASAFIIIGWDKKDGQDIFAIDDLAEAMRGCLAVVHLAGLRGPDCDTEDLDGRPVKHSDYHRINYGGTEAVIKAAKKAGVKRIIFISSGAVYGTKYFPKDNLPGDKEVAMETRLGYIVQEFETPISDSSPYPDHLHPYAQCKLDTEKLLEKEAKNGLSAISLRINGIDASSGFWSTSSQNVARAIELAIKSNIKGFERFNIADKHCRVNVSRAVEMLGY